MLILSFCIAAPSDETQGNPVFIGVEENCKYLFTWATNLACAQSPVTPQVPCAFTDPNSGNLYDLTPLIKSDSNWIAVDDSEAFYFTYSLNLCRPLVNTSYTQGVCGSGVAGCQAIRNGSNSFVSLGQVSSPYLDGDTLVVTLSSV